MKSLVSLNAIFSLYRFPVGRRLFALRGVRDALKAAPPSADVDVLVALVEEAVKHDLMTQEMIARAGLAPGSFGASVARNSNEIDTDLDRTLGALYAVLEAKHRALKPDSKERAAVARILDLAFPNGVFATILLTHPEEAAVVARLVAMMLPIDDARSLVLETPADEQWDWRGKLAKDVETAGLAGVVSELADLHAEFDAALKLGKPAPAVTKDEARAANATGQEYLLGLVAAIVGRWPRPTDVDAKTRGAVLRPILQQNDAIAAYYRRQRRPKDIDPATGENVDTVDIDADTEPEPAPAPAPGTEPVEWTRSPRSAAAWPTRGCCSAIGEVFKCSGRALVRHTLPIPEARSSTFLR
jgi:hypothetical protein